MRALLGLVLVLAGCSASVAAAPLETIERHVGTGPGPVVLLLHGYSSAPETFIGLTERHDLPGGTLLVLPRAPLPVPNVDHGTMWWPLPQDIEEITRHRMPGMDDARARVSALLDHLATAYPHRPIVLGGFSQGAMVSLDVALHDTTPLAGLALFSGAPIDEQNTNAALDSRRGLRVFASHGTADRVLSYDDDMQLMAAMRAHDLDVQFMSFDGGHVVTPQISDQFAAFITRCASAP